MNALHTPGPWRTHHDGSTKVIAGDYTICCTWYRTTSPPRDQANANARLIAAAPELLAAIKRLLDDDCPYECSPDSCECGENGDGTNRDGEPCCHRQARAAIAKAEPPRPDVLIV